MDNLLVKLIANSYGLPDPDKIIKRIEDIFRIKVTHTSKEKYFVCVRTIAACVLGAYGFNYNQIKHLLKYKNHSIIYSHTPFAIALRVSYIQDKYPERAEEFSLEFGIDMCLLCTMAPNEGLDEVMNNESVKAVVGYYDRYATLPNLLPYEEYADEAIYMDLSTKQLFKIKKDDFGFEYGWSEAHIKSLVVVAKALIMRRYYERQISTIIRGD